MKELMIAEMWPLGVQGKLTAFAPRSPIKRMEDNIEYFG